MEMSAEGHQGSFLDGSRGGEQRDDDSGERQGGGFDGMEGSGGEVFREYCVADLSAIRRGEAGIGLRWRTRGDVLRGKGTKVCAAVDCEGTEGLKSFEVDFRYVERGVDKRALVKVRLCKDCIAAAGWLSSSPEDKRGHEHEHKRSHKKRHEHRRHHKHEPKPKKSRTEDGSEQACIVVDDDNGDDDDDVDDSDERVDGKDTAAHEKEPSDQVEEQKDS